MQNPDQPQPGPSTWTAQHHRIPSRDPSHPQYPIYPQYSPGGLNYYPNQPQPTTPPASAPPIPHPSPTAPYYPRPEYQPTSAPPHAAYGYYPGYAVDYSRPTASAPTESNMQYDPRQYRPQPYYAQQQFHWQNYGHPPPPQPVKVESSKRSGEEPSEEKPKKSKKARKEEPILPRPPAKSLLNPPRQAQSAWQLFFADELNRAKNAVAASPGGTVTKLNVAQVAKDAGTAYGNLDAERKAYYAQKVQESKDTYAKELLAWQATLTPEDIRIENAFRAQQRKDGKSRKANLKDPRAPKKALSAYFLFLKSIREDSELRARVWGEEVETTKQSVLAAAQWRALTDEEKKPYLQRAEKDKAEYEAIKKMYEDDSAARARGEQVPDRPNLDAQTNVAPPLSMRSPLFADTGFDLDIVDQLPDQTAEWSELHHLMVDKEKPEKEFDSLFLT